MKFLKKIKESRLNLILLLLYPIVTFYLLECLENHEGNSAGAQYRNV